MHTHAHAYTWQADVENNDVTGKSFEVTRQHFIEYVSDILKDTRKNTVI